MTMEFEGDELRSIGAEALVLEQPAEVSLRSLPGVWGLRGIALMAADFFIVVSTFLVAYYLRFHLQWAIKHANVQPVEIYLKGALLLASLWVFMIWRDGGYEVGIRGTAAPIVRIKSLLIAGVYALGLLMVISYLYRGLLLSRQVYLMTGAMAFFVMTLLRILFRELDRDLASLGLALRQVVVVGMDAQTEEFAKRLTRAGTTLKLAGFISAEASCVSERFANAPALGTLAEIETIYERQPFDKLVLSHATTQGAQSGSLMEQLIGIVNFCEANSISLYMLPNAMNVAVTQNEVGTFSGMPVVKLRDASLHRGYAVIKRAMDMVLAGLALILGMPLWIAIAVYVKMSSQGPVFFTQTRIGLHGKPFKIYKFRSMVADAEARLKELVDIDKLEVPGFKIKGDPRVTRIGKFLRRTSLDEIPQFINVLRGEMSLVGPRPEMPDIVQRYNCWQRRRLKAKPGITGYQQIMARGIPLAAAIDYDLIYLKHQGLLLDLYIILKTVEVVLRGKGVTH